MVRTLRIISVILLVFLGISAIGGGIMLIHDPTGNEYGMPIYFLENTPFNSFFIPGIILLVINGLLSTLFAILILRNNKYSPWLVLIQGCILLGWLVIEILMIREYEALLHTLYLLVGVGMVVSAGCWLKVTIYNH